MLEKRGWMADRKMEGVMLTDEQLYERFAGVACPQCLQTDYELRLRCDFGMGDCLYVAACRRCGRQFHFESIAAVDELMHTVWRHAQQARCPVCGSNDLRAHFVCDPGKRECYAHVRCPLGDFERRSQGVAAALRPW